MQHSSRIVSLISSGTEILYCLGLQDCLVAASHECDFPTAALAKPRATRSNIDSRLGSLAIDEQVRELSARGATLYELDDRLLVELQPELIVTQAQCDVCAVRYDDVISLVCSRPELAATRVLALNPQSLADVLADIVRVGETTGCAAEARRLAASLQARVDVVRARTGSLPAASRPRVACLEWLEPLMFAANWTPELVEFAGGHSGLTQAGRHSAHGTWPDLVAYDPEVLVLMPCGFDLPRTLLESARLKDWPGYRDLAAVRRGQVFAVDGNAYFNRSGPRLVESLEILAHLVHPGVFSPPLTEDMRARAWQRL